MQKHQQAKTIDNGKRQAPATKWGKIRKQNEARIVGVMGGEGGGGTGVRRGRGRRPHAHNQTGSHGQPLQFAYAWVAGRYKEWRDTCGRRGGTAVADRLPTGGVQVCPARPSAHDFTVFRPLLINFRPSGICKVTKSGKHTQHNHTERNKHSIINDNKSYIIRKVSIFF